MSHMAGSSSDDPFAKFYNEVKQVEQRDSVLTSSQQIFRLLRPGATYFNLNPFEVLQVDPEDPIEMMKKKYKRLSILIHPDKNPEDRERADKAFDVLKKAMTTLEDPDELDRCRKVVEEATARTHIAVEEKRKQLRREGKPQFVDEDDPEKMKKAIQVLTLKIFAERERKRLQLTERANEEKKRLADEELETAAAKRAQEEYAKRFEESRDDRVGSWNKFRTNKDKRKTRGMFKPPKPRLETSGK